jgi:LacI family transcriptional regulator
MTDVAKLAGVSHQTVSRVLNGSPRVRPETRERVLRAVDELDYRPNAMARGLVSRRSKLLGVVTGPSLAAAPRDVNAHIVNANIRAVSSLTPKEPE